VIKFEISDCGLLCPNNLVPNPSFELFSSCPTGLGQIGNATFWSMPTTANPDYFHTCVAPAATFVPTVPTNLLGTQVPRSGQGYGGFVPEGLSTSYSEYVQINLSSPLVAGNSYDVSFYVSLADEATHAVDNIGAYLSNGIVGPTGTTAPLTFIPQIQSPNGNFVTNKVGWTLISGTLVAAGGEDHIIIGNFDNTPSFQVVSGTLPFAYYFIDDVSVCPSCTIPPCDTCFCKSELTLGHNGIQYPVFCDFHTGFVPSFECTADTVIVSGFFGCASQNTGEPCAETNVNWQLTGPDDNPILSGVSTNYLTLLFTPVLLSVSGKYTLTFFTYCPGSNDTCVCTIIWVQEECDTCRCDDNSFSGLYINGPEAGQTQQVNCNQTISLSCPTSPSQSIHVTGQFLCHGDNCSDSSAVITEWVTPYGNFNQGQDVNDYFDFLFVPQSSGTYDMLLSGFCDPLMWNLFSEEDTCHCPIRIEVNCPRFCPCESDDINAFESAVNKGYTQIIESDNCSACFSPIALSDCEAVEWYLNSVDGILLGKSTGNEPFCYNFPWPGEHEVIMNAIRKGENDQFCATFSRSEIVRITCSEVQDCIEPAVFNPGFSIGAQAGGMENEGMSSGWTYIAGNPIVIEGSQGSEDNWTIQLSGNLDSMDILKSVENVCIDTEEDVLLLRMKGGTALSERRCDRVRAKIIGQSGSSIVINIPIPMLSTTDWTNLQIPLNVGGLIAADTCGENSIAVQLEFSVTNALHSDQGGNESYSIIEIDEICLSNLLVGNEKMPPRITFQIFPNPTSGDLMLEIPEIISQELSIHIVSFTGQILLSQKAESGKGIQTIDTYSLPTGMYIVQIISEGRVMGINKFVKM